MEKFWDSSSKNLAVIFVGSEEFWRENIHGGWATILVLFFILICQFLGVFTPSSSSSRRSRSTSVATDQETNGSRTKNPQTRVAEIVSDLDLSNLIKELDGTCDDDDEIWENVIDKRDDNLIPYNAKCCKPKDGPLKYISVTVFENCSAERLRDFYMDNEYRRQWDNVLVEHEQLEVDETNGIEIGRMVKKLPFLTPREYVLARRLWEGKDKTFFCLTKYAHCHGLDILLGRIHARIFSMDSYFYTHVKAWHVLEGKVKTFYSLVKECEHALAPRQKKYVRVGVFRSGWRIRRIPGRNACELKMVHQEDAGLNVGMTKLAFSKGIWGYVCKMDAALRKYSPICSPQSSSVMTAVMLLQKVPPELDTATETAGDIPPLSSSSNSSIIGREIKQENSSRLPSKTTILDNGLLLLGSVVLFLSCTFTQSNFGGKLAVVCILKKLSKHGTTSSSVASPS